MLYNEYYSNTIHSNIDECGQIHLKCQTQQIKTKQKTTNNKNPLSLRGEKPLQRLNEYLSDRWKLFRANTSRVGNVTLEKIHFRIKI